MKKLLARDEKYHFVAEFLSFLQQNCSNYIILHDIVKCFLSFLAKKIGQSLVRKCKVRLFFDTDYYLLKVALRTIPSAKNCKPHSNVMEAQGALQKKKSSGHFSCLPAIFFASFLPIKRRSNKPDRPDVAQQRR